MNNDWIKTKNEIWIAGEKSENNGQLKHDSFTYIFRKRLYLMYAGLGSFQSKDCPSLIFIEIYPFSHDNIAVTTGNYLVGIIFRGK